MIIEREAQSIHSTLTTLTMHCLDLYEHRPILNEQSHTYSLLLVLDLR